MSALCLCVTIGMGRQTDCIVKNAVSTVMRWLTGGLMPCIRIITGGTQDVLAA